MTHNLYIFIVRYTRSNGNGAKARVLVGAPDATTAINKAVAAVRALPHCAQVLGGTCVPMTPKHDNVPHARAPTHPAHTTLN